MLSSPQPLTRFAALRIAHITHQGVTFAASPPLPCFEDLILRFASRPDLDIFSGNEAERTIRPVKVQQRGSGGCWRTLTGLSGFALAQSYLFTVEHGSSANSPHPAPFQRTSTSPIRHVLKSLAAEF
jgi:hypothetical protein